MDEATSFVLRALTKGGIQGIDFLENEGLAFTFRNVEIRIKIETKKLRKKNGITETQGRAEINRHLKGAPKPNQSKVNIRN